MNGNESRTLWLSVGAAIFAMVLLWSWSQKTREQVEKKFKSNQRVVVAAKDINMLQTLDESMLDIVERPGDFIEPEAVNDPQNVIGQVAATPIKKGEQLLQTKLLAPGPETGLSMEVVPGKRAVTIPVDDMRGVSRLIRPGDRIDVLTAVDSGQGTTTKREVRTLLQNVVVLATGLHVRNNLPRRIELDANGKTVTQINFSSYSNYTMITIEANPEDSQKLVYVMSLNPGNIFVTLRNRSDQYITNLPSIGSDTILGKPEIRAPTSITPPPVQTIAPQVPPGKVKRRGRAGYEDL